jgi:hypothetical protein
MKLIKKFEEFSTPESWDNLSKKRGRKLDHLVGQEFRFNIITYRDDDFRKDTIEYKRKTNYIGTIEQVLDWDIYDKPKLVVEISDRVFKISYDGTKDIFYIDKYYLVNQIVGKRVVDKNILDEFKEFFYGQLIDLDQKYGNQ